MSARQLVAGALAALPLAGLAACSAAPCPPVPTTTPQNTCEIVYTDAELLSRSDFIRDELDRRVGYWVAPNGTQIGWSLEEDTTVWNAPYCALSEGAES